MKIVGAGAVTLLQFAVENLWELVDGFVSMKYSKKASYFLQCTQMDKEEQVFKAVVKPSMNFKTILCTGSGC
jgi:hypothetical protein